MMAVLLVRTIKKVSCDLHMEHLNSETERNRFGLDSNLTNGEFFKLARALVTLSRCCKVLIGSMELRSHLITIHNVLLRKTCTSFEAFV